MNNFKKRFPVSEHELAEIKTLLGRLASPEYPDGHDYWPRLSSKLKPLAEKLLMLLPFFDERISKPKPVLPCCGGHDHD